MKRRPSHSDHDRRRGTIMPLLAVALVATCLAGALVLDRMWIDAAEVQLNAAAQAAALAAAAQLADDDRLREPYDASANFNDALAAADFIVRGNYVHGRPVELLLTDDGDVRFGRIVSEPASGEPIFLETDVNPTSVLVVTRRSRERANPLLLFFRGLTGQPTVNALGHAEASLDNRVIGLRPLPGATVPCLPLGILEADRTGDRAQTWHRQIDLRDGEDRFGYDEWSDTLIEQPDGIPEITLTVGQAADGPDITNVSTLNLGSDLIAEYVKLQITGGIGEDDLSAFDGELILDQQPLRVDASPSLVTGCLDELQTQIGSPRICFLYQEGSPTSDVGSVYATRLIAIRILTLESPGGGAAQLVVQPTIIATRAAVLSEFTDADPNPYIFKLHLTH